ncbi:MAG: hypothetical protein FWG28_03245 [Clostridiales bacterium]|nr:hypothetical protein [Clostridiales bacterium]
MTTLFMYYSYSGHTRAIARELAAAESADLAEVQDVKRPGGFKAFTLGCFAALRGKAWPIQEPAVDPGKYERLVVLFPIWAGNPPPAAHALLAILPQGKPVAVKMVSGSGKSNCREKVEAAIKARGCTVESFEDVKAK